jgi:hypothetical protein
MYSGVRNALTDYWRAYGGTKALMRSPYLHAALVIGALSWPRSMDKAWPSEVTSIIPNILGFSLSAYAILLAFGDKKFLAFIQSIKDENGVSYLNGLSATFIHFILFQVVAIIMAIVVGSHLSNLPKAVGSALSFLCYVIFMYSIMVAVAAAIALFRISSLYNIFADQDEDNEKV